MRWLVDRARDRGVAVATGASFDGAQRIGAGWRSSDGMETRFLVGADGPKSRVAQVGALGVNTRFLYGEEVEIVGATLDEPDRLHCFLDARRARGYIGWLFSGARRVQAGLAGTHVRGGGTPDVDEFVGAIAARVGLAGGASGMQARRVDPDRRSGAAAVRRPSPR